MKVVSSDKLMGWGRTLTLEGSAIVFGRAEPITQLPEVGDDWPATGLQILLHRNVVRRGPAVNCDFRARISVGAGSGSYTFDCEWQQGVGIPVLGSAVTISVVPYAPDPNRTSNVGDFKLALTACLGPRGMTSIPPIYQNQLELTEEEPEQVLTPPILARAFSVFAESAIGDWWTNPSPYASLMVRQEHQSATGNGWGTIPGPVLAGGGAVPLGAGDTRVRLRSTSANPMRVVVLWHLAP